MKLYTINMNGNPIHVRASRASVALMRAAQLFRESELMRASFIIVSSRKIEYQYFLLADVLHDASGSRKKEIVAGPFLTEGEALAQAADVETQHPNYNFVRVQKAEKQS